jgi:hypothetical protein
MVATVIALMVRKLERKSRRTKKVMALMFNTLCACSEELTFESVLYMLTHFLITVL